MSVPIGAAGRKVFLLHPHSVIKDEMLDVLIMAGYETYTIFDEARARKMLAKFPDSIMFINIDEGLKESEWEAYVKTIQGSPETKESRLGIMSYNQDMDLMQKYLMKLEIPCGYVQLKLGLKESTKIMLGALEANEARGQRKCIRAVCQDDLGSTLNFKDGTVIYHGDIQDISASGLAVKFDKFAAMPGNSVLHDVQLKLRGGLVMTDMVLMGQRQDNKNIYVLLFDNKLTIDNKLVIHRYIKQCLQRYVDSLKV